MNKLAKAKIKISQYSKRLKQAFSGLVAFSIFGFGLPTIAQSGTSSAITGTIVDPARSVIAGAAVTASEVNTGATRTAQSSTTGRFLFSQLNPGTYRISVIAEGFASQESASITVAVGQIAAVNFALSLGGTSQSVPEAMSLTLEVVAHRRPLSVGPSVSLAPA